MRLRCIGLQYQGERVSMLSPLASAVLPKQYAGSGCLDCSLDVMLSEECIGN